MLELGVTLNLVVGELLDAFLGGLGCVVALETDDLALELAYFCLSWWLDPFWSRFWQHWCRMYYFLGNG